MKKILLGAGAIAAVATPVATVVACGDNDSKTGVDLVADLAKFKNQEISSKDRVAFAEIFKTLKVGDEISEDQLGFSSATLSTGVTAEIRISSAYDDTAGYVQIEVTLKKGDEKVMNNTKKIGVFTSDHIVKDMKTELEKINNNYHSMYTVKQLVERLKHKYNVTQADLGVEITGLDPTTVVQLELLEPYTGASEDFNVHINLLTDTKAPQGYEQNSKSINIIAKQA